MVNSLVGGAQKGDGVVVGRPKCRAYCVEGHRCSHDAVASGFCVAHLQMWLDGSQALRTIDDGLPPPVLPPKRKRVDPWD